MNNRNGDVLEKEAAMEAELEHYEMEQLTAVHRNCENARLDREAEQTRMQEKQARIARRQEWAAQEARRQMLEYKATNAVRYYGVLCLVVMLISALTQFPFYAMAALILGGAVFPAAYIFRLYYPPEEE